VILPSASARSCSRTARASPTIGTSTSRLCPSWLGLMSTWITLRSAAKRGGRPKLDHPVEPRADGEDDIGLGERFAARVEEGQRVILGVRPREIGFV